MQNIVVVGATSAIAQAVARRFADKKCAFLLIARNKARLGSVADDLAARGSVSVVTATFDASMPDQSSQVVEKASEHFNRVDLVILAHGSLVDQTAAEQSVDALIEAVNVNAVSAMALAGEFANLMEQQSSGSIVVISSVAGDRGRKSNYVYGSAKAALTAYCGGLRNRLAGKDIHVLTVKPGLVDTPMTAAFPKGPLWATSEQVGSDIVRGIERRKDIIYTPGFWRLIMFVIRSIPERIFKRMSL